MCNKNMRIKNSLRKLIYKLRISFTNKKIRKKLKALVAFLINQNIGGQLGFLPAFFFLKIIRSKLWESHLAKKKKKYANSSAENLCGECNDSKTFSN